MAITFQVTFDCADPRRLAEFWAAALGYKQEDPPSGYATWEDWLRAHSVPKDQWNSANAIRDPAGSRPRIYFQRVPEPKTVKNRVHLDLNVGGGEQTPMPERQSRVMAEAERLTALGATQLWAMEQRGEFWVVMADPEGNEFCLQ